MDARNRLSHHLAVATASLVMIIAFAMTGSIEKAFGRTAFILLVITLSIGPMMRLWKPASKLLPIRGEFGTWFAITGLTHAILIFTGGGVTVIGADGTGLAILMGMVALFWALILASTSSGRAVRFLGPDNWKWLHGFSYVIFYLVALHVIYFLFISPGAIGEPSRYFILVVILAVPTLQIASFIKQVMEYNKQRR